MAKNINNQPQIVNISWLMENLDNMLSDFCQVRLKLNY